MRAMAQLSYYPPVSSQTETFESLTLILPHLRCNGLSSYNWANFQDHHWGIGAYWEGY